MLRSSFVFRLLPRRLSVSSITFNIHFQGKLDEEIKKAVGDGKDKPSLIYDHLGGGVINAFTYKTNFIRKSSLIRTGQNRTGDTFLAPLFRTGQNFFGGF